MADNLKVVTYEPDNSLKKGYFQLIDEIILEVVSNRWLTYQMFKRDLSAMHKQSFIGLLWIFIIPLVNVGVFAMLSGSGIFNAGEINVPFPIYAVLGISFWQIFSAGLTACGTSLSNAGAMITRINFSRKSLVASTLGRPIMSFFIQLILVAVLFACYQIMPNIGILWMPVIIIPIILLTLGLGFVAALLNAIMRDTGNLLTIALSFLMYLTPVLYAKPQTGILASLTHYNPMYYLLSAGRDLALTGTITEVTGFIASVVFSVVMFFASIIFFHLTEARITERI